MEVKLRVLVGQAKGKEIPLPKSQFIIGRDSVCHLRPHSPLVSKFHCAIGRSASGAVVIRDLKSSNKTFLNGQPVTRTVRVENGDLLRIGPLRFEFVILETEEDQRKTRLTKEHFHWLMEEAPDSFDLDSDTTIVGLPSIEFGDGEPTSRPDPSSEASSHDEELAQPNQELSAGRYLHEFLSQQEHTTDSP